MYFEKNEGQVSLNARRYGDQMHVSHHWSVESFTTSTQEFINSHHQEKKENILVPSVSTVSDAFLHNNPYIGITPST